MDDHATLIRTDHPAHAAAPDAQPAADADDVVRPLLWLLLLVLAVGNVVTSGLGLVLVSVPLGVGVLACAAALVARHRRRRA